MEFHDVLLINPPSKVREIFEHLGLGYIAACLRKQHIDVKILNMPKWTVNRALEEVKKFRCKIIGVSIPFQDGAELALNFISRFKEEGFNGHVTIGGIYPTFSYQEIMERYPAIDSVVLGEGEETFVELAKAIINDKSWQTIKGIVYHKNNEVVVNDFRPLIKDLDTIPFPERDSLPEVLKKLNFASMLTSRGCYGRCSFCSVIPFYAKFGPKYRLRSSKNVLEELEMLYYKFGVRNFEFNDANFIGGKGKGSQRAREIAENILRKNMDLRISMQCRADDVDEELFVLLKRAGLSKVFLGVESGSQTMLDRFKKDITVEENLKALEILGKLDLVVIMGFITFDDQITLKEFQENLRFIKKAKRIIPFPNLKCDPVAKIIPLAGTEVEQHLKQTNKYKGNTLRFAYRLDNPGLNLLYNSVNGLANFARTFKRTLNITNANDMNWQKK